MSTQPHTRTDLTRWNRAGLTRFNYLDGDAATWLEELRLALLGQYMRGEPEAELRNPDAWRDLWLDETDSARRDGRDLDAQAAKVTWDRIAPKTPKALESRAQRAARLLDQYTQGPDGDHAWEIMRAFARASHVLTGHLNAYANEGYLRTATQWDNLRRIAGLVNYHPNPPASASTLVTLTLKPESDVSEIATGLAMEFAPDDGGAPLVFETSAPVLAHPDLNAAALQNWQSNATPIRVDTPLLLWTLPEKSKLATGDLVAFTDGQRGQAATVTSVMRKDGDQTTASILTDAATQISIRTDAATLLTEAEAVRTGLPRPTEGTYNLYVPNGVGLQKGDLVRVMADAFDEVVHVVDTSGREIQIKTEATLNGVIQLFPLSAIKRDGLGAFEVGAQAGGTLYYLTRNGIDVVPSSDSSDRVTPLRDSEKDEVQGFSFKAEGPLTDIAYFEASAQTGKPVEAYIKAVSRDTIGAGTDADKIVRFAGKPPKSMTTGDWMIARGAADTSSKAVRIEKLTTGASDYTVTFGDRVSSPSETTEFHGPMKTALRPLGYNVNPALAFTGDARVVTIEGITANAQSVLRPGRSFIFSDRSRPDGSGDVEATLTNIVPLNNDRVTLTFEPAASLDHMTVGQTRVCLNAVTVTHGETKGPKTLGSGDGEFGAQIFTLEVAGVSHIPSAQAVSGVVPDLVVSIDDDRWDYRDYSDLSAEGTQAFSTTLGDDGFLRLHFRRRLPTGTNNVTVLRHRIGNGIRGNLVPPLGFTKPMRKHRHVATVYQPFPTSGGANREPVESLRKAIPSRLVANGRAVSLSDFERLAQGHASVLRAHATEHPTASRFREVAITVVPSGGALLTTGLKDDIATMVKTHAIPGLALELQSYGPVQLRIGVLIRADLTIFDRTDLLAEAQVALLSAFSLETRDFGQVVYVAEVLATLEQVTGVTTAQVTTFDYVRDGSNGTQSPARTAQRDRAIAAIYPHATQVGFLAANGTHLSIDVKGDSNG
jgi:hypothetical protein